MVATGTAVTAVPEKKVAQSSSSRFIYLHLRQRHDMDIKKHSSNAGMRLAAADPPLSGANHRTKPKKLKRRSARRKPLAAQAITAWAWDICVDTVS